MGAYAPLPWLPAGLTDDIVRTVALPTVDEMARRGTPFAGLLYIGLAMTAAGPRVVEFNARFGDPETQVVLALLETPLGALLHAAATGGLAGHPPLRWRDGAAVTVVLAAAGYPGTPRTGDVHHRQRPARRDPRRHPPPRRRRDRVGRRPGAVGHRRRRDAGRGARQRLRPASPSIDLPGGQYRTDIALRAVHGEIRLDA